MNKLIHRPRARMAWAISLSLSLFALAAAPAVAQETSSLRLEGTGGQVLHTVPIQAGPDAILINPNGAVTVRCVPNSAGNACEGVASPRQVPTLTGFGIVSPTVVDGRPRVEAGQTFYMNWNSTGAQVCLASTASTPALGLQGWSGLQALQATDNAPAGGLRFDALPSGTDLIAATVSLECFNSDGSVKVDYAVDVVRPAGGSTGCALASSPYIQPAGFTRSTQGWSQWGGTAAYPPLSGGKREISIPAMSYVVLPFTPTAGASLSISTATNQNLGIPWNGFLVTVSPCQGDFRPPVSQGQTPPVDDPTLAPGCRRLIGGGETTTPLFDTQAPGRGCLLQPGQTYYLNIIQTNFQGVINRTSQCSANACGPQYTWE